jgi:hypothetical protein
MNRYDADLGDRDPGTALQSSMTATVPGQSSGPPALTRPQAQDDAVYVLDRAAAAQVDSYRMISVDQSRSGVIYTDAAARQQRIVSALCARRLGIFSGQEARSMPLAVARPAQLSVRSASSPRDATPSFGYAL